MFYLYIYVGGKVSWSSGAPPWPSSKRTTAIFYAMNLIDLVIERLVCLATAGRNSSFFTTFVHD